MKNILIVEDNAIARINLKNILLTLGEEADIAIDGEQAIEKIKIHHYALILMDIGLPKKRWLSSHKYHSPMGKKNNFAALLHCCTIFTFRCRNRKEVYSSRNECLLSQTVVRRNHC